MGMVGPLSTPSSMLFARRRLLRRTARSAQPRMNAGSIASQFCLLVNTASAPLEGQGHRPPHHPVVLRRWGGAKYGRCTGCRHGTAPTLALILRQVLLRGRAPVFNWWGTGAFKEILQVFSQRSQLLAVAGIINGVARFAGVGLQIE